MKKIFTLLFSVGMFTLAQAQPGPGDDRPFDQRNDQRNDQRFDQRNDQHNDQRNDQKDLNNGFDKTKDPFYNNPYDKNVRFDDRFSMERRMKMEIARINQEYDFKIEKVRCDYYMRWYEKQRQISYLEQYRQWEIRRVYAKFNYRNQFDNCYDRNGRYERHDRYNGHY